MTTIVNSPAPATESNGGIGFLIGAVLLIGFALIVFYFGLPVIRNLGSAQINVPAPQINVPAKIDVNVTQPK